MVWREGQINQGLAAPPQSRQWSIHCLGDTNTYGNRIDVTRSIIQYFMSH